MESLESRVLMSADVVIKWNNVLIDAVRHEQTHAGPGWVSRNMAVVQTAVFDAVNAVAGGYKSYRPAPAAVKGASVDAAASMAAYETLLALYPQQKTRFDAAMNQEMKSIPDNVGEANGLIAGHDAAQQILSGRNHDNSLKTVKYTPGKNPGKWQPTWPNYASALGAGWYAVTPFVLKSGSQFRAPPPPALTSQQYTNAFNQVKSIGAKDSTTRTAEQTQIGHFWAYDTGAKGTPVVLYNQIAQKVAQQQGNTTEQNARLFALMNLAMADSGISAWDTKYAYNFWRPITAIRNANTDGNPATVADKNWQPLGAPGDGTPNFTPPFPAYVSGHSTFGAAAFTVLRRFFGTDNIRFTVGSDELPGVKRTFSSFSQAADENGISRIYLGIHWAFDNTQGKIMGEKVGNYVFSNALTPISGKTPSQPALTLRAVQRTPVFSTQAV